MQTGASGRSSQRSAPPSSLPLRGCTAEELLAQQFPPQEPLASGLVHRRDMVTIGARRRHGKTSMVTNLAVALAVPVRDFLGYEIPAARRSLLLILEDDPGEYQEKLRRVIDGRDCAGRIRIITREDFYASNIPIDVRQPQFQKAVHLCAHEHQPDLIVMDNLAHIINAEYNDPSRVQQLVVFCYKLARDHNAAIILAAHPKKGDDQHPVSLRKQPGRFFESIMGTSHLINSTGSLWGLERPENEDYSVFVGGRQRGDGHQGHSYIAMDDSGWFQLVHAALANLPLVLNTPARQQAWRLLPNPPASFGYREGQELVRSAISSSSTYTYWMRECRRLEVIIEQSDGRLSKAPGLPSELVHAM